MKKLEKWEKIFLGVVIGVGSFIFAGYTVYNFIIPIGLVIMYFFLREEKKNGKHSNKNS